MMKIFAAFLLIAALAACDMNSAALEGDVELSRLAIEQTYTGEPLPVTDAAVTPSTNAENEVAGWAHVGFVEARVGEVDLELVSTRTFASCFEFRVDDAPAEGTNFNPGADGLYPFTCVNNTTTPQTIEALEYVDVRMVFGAETDERFDWTRFYVLTEKTKDDCKDGAWEALGFRNQGQCIASIVSNGNSAHNR